MPDYRTPKDDEPDDGDGSRPDDEPEDDPDDEPESTFVGTFNMPVDPNFEAKAAAFEGMVRNIEEAARNREAAEQTRAQREANAARLVDRQLAEGGESKRSAGAKSRWHPPTLRTITQRLAAGESARSIARDPAIDVSHQRISELRKRGDTYWDNKERKLVTPEGTTTDTNGYYVLPQLSGRQSRVRR
jgi:hypothetical protein